FYPVQLDRRDVADYGFAKELRRDLCHDARRAERRDHQPADHGLSVFLPVVPDGQGHGTGDRPAADRGHGELAPDAAVEPRRREHVLMTTQAMPLQTLQATSYRRHIPKLALALGAVLLL